MDGLILRTLGGAGLLTSAGTPVLGPGKALALILYLALTPGHRVSREFLLDLLWADLDPERGRRALRQALFQVRRILGEDAVSGTEELLLRAAVRVDRDEFLEAIACDDLEAALAIYQGPFLPAFGVPGGAAFEHWADLERDRTQTAFLRCAEIAVRRRLNQARFREAQHLARRVREVAPGMESSWRLVLEAAIAARDFVTASVEAEALERWSAEEGRPLEPASRAAIAEARHLPPNPARPESAGLAAELTGREREFSAITSAWAAVKAGGAKHLHLTAPAGFGKTRLLQDALARLLASGARVVRLSANPGDRDVPGALAADLAAALAGLPGATGLAPGSAAALVALNPALSGRFRVAPDSAQGEEAVRRRMYALADLVQACAHEQPFVLALDDLHWADPVSYRIVEGVFNRLAEARVLCLTASRPERPPAGTTFTVLPLAALSEDQVGSLVSALGGLPMEQPWAATFVRRLHGATRGSPLLLLETLRLSLDRAILALENNEWRCQDESRLVAVLRAGEALRERVRALPSPEGWLLALLAIAGTHLDDETLAVGSALSPDELRRRLAPLERQGLVVRVEAGWLLTHDEIGAAVREGLPPARQAEANRIMGTRYARGEGDAHRLIRAARHFGAAGDESAVRLAFRRYVALARRRGDRRRLPELAGEFCGEGPHASRAIGLVSSLPPIWRAGLWSPVRQVAALGLAIAAPAALLLARARDAEIGLPRLVYRDSLGVTTAVEIKPGDWNASAVPFLPRPGASAMAGAAASHAELPPAVSPDGRSVAWIQDTGDSTTLDIWIRTPAGTRRLTHQVRDDLVEGWLPDGSALVGTTNRWSPRGNGDYDLAVFDTATGQARQITHGPAHENHPYASPDGTRLGFIRIFDEEPPRLCVIAIAGGGEPECRLINGHPLVTVVGWSGLMELVVILDEGDTRTLVRYDWLRDVSAPLLGPHVDQARISPDGRYVVAANRLDGIRGTRDWIVPISDPARARPVGRSGDRPGALRWWEGTPDRSLLIDRVEFADSVRDLMPGVGTRLRVRPLTVRGDEVPVRVWVRWQVSDTTVAVVDSTGVVRVRAPGDVTVTASLGGWRSASRRFHVAGASPVTILDERWDDGWRDRWLPWGDPAPIVVTGPGGIRGLWNRGDGSYPSTALLLRGLTARDGLGAEVRLSTPIGNPKWQRMRIVLAAGLDPAAFRDADHRKAPPALGRAEAMCGVTFPGQNKWGENRLAIESAVTHQMDLGEAGRRLRSGAWWTLRLQILPDGRCGVALNGKPIWISPEPVAMGPEYRLRVGDESANTRILHGPLTLWTGVRTDLDWARVGR